MNKSIAIGRAAIDILKDLLRCWWRNYWTVNS